MPAVVAVALATSDIVALFACAGLVLYVAARAAVDAVTSATDPAPGKMALAHWLPIASAALLATLAGHSEIGITLALATSVAAVGLVLGVLLCVAPDHHDDATRNNAGAARLPAAAGGPVDRAAAWPFVLAATLLLLLAGFSGFLNGLHAVMLLGLGACVWSVWRASARVGAVPSVSLATEKRGLHELAGFSPPPPQVTSVPPAALWQPAGATEQSSASGYAADTATAIAERSMPPASAGSASPAAAADVRGHSARAGDADAGSRNRYWRAQLLLSIALALVGGWMGYKGVTVADDRTRVATSALISLAVLSPLLVLPLLGTGATAASHGRLNAAVATIVGVILLNLCLLVPLVIAIHYARQLPAFWIANPHTWESLRDTLRPLTFPLSAWRVDTVLLVVFGLMLIPVSLGRWRLGKIEGLGLAFVYAAYLIASTALAIRM